MIVICGRLCGFLLCWVVVLLGIDDVVEMEVYDGMYCMRDFCY